MKLTIKRLSTALNKIGLETEDQPVPTSWQEYVLQESAKVDNELSSMPTKPKPLSWQEYLTKLGRKLGK